MRAISFPFIEVESPAGHAFVLTPLTYLDGVFYSITLLPDCARNLSKFNPIFYMASAFRYGTLSNEPDMPIVMSFTMIIIFIVALFSFAL